MQTLVEAASHIAQEIERTQQHLRNLELALEGLKPLITIDAATTALPFTAAVQIQAVEDASIVNAEVSTKRVPKRKKTKSKVAKPIEVPATGADLWLACLGRKKFSTAELVSEALMRLELGESARAVIANRARAWLHASVKGGVIETAGMRDGTALYKRAVTKAL